MRQDRKVRGVLFDFGNTLVTYYSTSAFPAVLQRCLEECRDALGWSYDTDRDQALFVRALTLNKERPDGAVWPLDERLNELFENTLCLTMPRWRLCVKRS